MVLPARVVRLRRRPRGEVGVDDFEIADVAIRDPAPGYVVVRNRWMAVDAFTRARLEGACALAYAVGAELAGPALGEVLSSAEPRIPEGTIVVHDLGWRDVALIPATAVRPVEVDAVAPSAHLGVLGRSGEVAHGAIHELASVGPGDVVLVSTAAGAVGVVAVQLARRCGARVLGITGSEEKAAFLTDQLGVDAVAVHRATDFARQLRTIAPDGIDVFLDGVGGAMLETALELLRPGGRIACCGQIAGYARGGRLPGPTNLLEVAVKGLTIRGIGALDFDGRRQAFLDDVAPAVATGDVRNVETVVNGLDAAPAALVALVHGVNVGRMVVALG